MSQKLIAIHQPNFFPWLGYFYKISQSDVFVILDNVDYQTGNHNSITSRTKIKCAGEEKYLIISVKKNKDSKLIKDIYLDKKSTQIKKHLKTIQLNYAKSKHFKEIYPLIERALIEFEHYELMSEANTHIIQTVCTSLGIKTPIIKASDLNSHTEDRNERIIEICKQLDGTSYFSGNGGKKYHDEDLFSRKGISIKYTDFKPQIYEQVGQTFIPGLSIIDVLLNCGIEKTKNMITLQ